MVISFQARDVDPGGDWGAAENSRGSGGPRSDPRPWAPREAAAPNKTPEVTTPPTEVCLFSCGLCRNSEDLSRVLQVIQRSKVTLNESVGSALVSSLAEGERVADIKPVLQQVSLELLRARRWQHVFLSPSDGGSSEGPESGLSFVPSLPSGGRRSSAGVPCHVGQDQVCPRGTRGITCGSFSGEWEDGGNG